MYNQPESEKILIQMKRSNYFQEEDFFQMSRIQYWQDICKLEQELKQHKQYSLCETRKVNITSSKVVAGVEILEKISLSLILVSSILHEPFTHHILTDDVVTLLCVIHNVSQLFHSFEYKKINYLRIGDVSVIPNLSRDSIAELRRSDDILKIVNVHDGGDRSTGSSKEIENTAASFRQVRRVRRNTDFPQREWCRHFDLRNRKISPSCLRLKEK